MCGCAAARNEERLFSILSVFFFESIIKIPKYNILGIFIYIPIYSLNENTLDVTLTPFTVAVT